MSRPLRIDYPGALWHVTSRGNERRAIVRDNLDRRRLLELLAETIAQHGWRLHSYALMDNHYHLLFETPDAGLSRAMQWLNSVYSQWFNRRHERVGHVFQGRFKAILVEKESHLLELSRYIVLNPVRAGIVEAPVLWPWSSYRATMGLASPPAWLHTDWILGQFGSTRSAAQGRYRDFVRAGIRETRSPYEDVVGQIYLGGEEFRQRLAECVPLRPEPSEVPVPQFRPVPLGFQEVERLIASAFSASISMIRSRRGGQPRLAAAYVARTTGRLKLTEIGVALGVSAARVSQLVADGRERRARDPEFRRRLDDVAVRLNG